MNNRSEPPQARDRRRQRWQEKRRRWQIALWQSQRPAHVDCARHYRPGNVPADIQRSGGAFQAGSGLPINELAADISRGRVDRVEERGGTELKVTYTDQTTKTAYKSQFSDFYQLMGALDVSRSALANVNFVPHPTDDTPGIIFQIVLGVVPILIIVWFLWRMMRSMRAGQDQAMSFGRSKPRVSRDMETAASDFQGCRRRRRSQGRSQGDRRIPQRAGEVHPLWGLACQKAC